MRLQKLAVLLLIGVAAASVAQEEGGNPLDFGLGIAIGSQSFENPGATGDEKRQDEPTASAFDGKNHAKNAGGLRNRSRAHGHFAIG